MMMMIFKSTVSSIVLMSILAPIYSFTVNNLGQHAAADFNKQSRRARHHEINLHMSSTDSPIGRRDAIQKTGSLLIFSSFFSLSNRAEAKDKEPVSLGTVRSSFQAVRDELSGGIKNLGVLVDNEEYEQIMDFTKEYDLEFRKAKMGKARKFLTSKEDKDKAVLLCNAVTFDLIGMNKGCRVGQRNIDQVKKYYEELKVDVQSFLELENNIDPSEYVS